MKLHIELTLSGEIILDPSDLADEVENLAEGATPTTAQIIEVVEKNFTDDWLGCVDNYSETLDVDKVKAKETTPATIPKPKAKP